MVTKQYISILNLETTINGIILELFFNGRDNDCFRWLLMHIQLEQNIQRKFYMMYFILLDFLNKIAILLSRIVLNQDYQHRQ
jgi:hypothetical protein